MHVIISENGKDIGCVPEADIVYATASNGNITFFLSTEKGRFLHFENLKERDFENIFLQIKDFGKKSKAIL